MPTGSLGKGGAGLSWVLLGLALLAVLGSRGWEGQAASSLPAGLDVGVA